MDKVRLSPSKLGSFLECPACFWREYHGKLPPSFPLPGILNRMDKLTKDYYDKYRGKLPPSIKGKVEGVLVDSSTASTVRGYMSYVDESLNAELRGKMDDCLISKGLIIPLDNKTASPSNESLLSVYKLQLDAYTFLLNHKGYKTADFGYLIYYTPESGTPDKGIVFRCEVKRLKMEPQHILKIFKDAVSLLRLSKPPKTHKDCEMCEWLREIES